MQGKQIGIVLIVIGVALMVWGYNSYDSFSSEVSRTITGETPVEAWIGLVAGGISFLLGLFKLK